MFKVGVFFENANPLKLICGSSSYPFIEIMNVVPYGYLKTINSFHRKKLPNKKTKKIYWEGFEKDSDDRKWYIIFMDGEMISPHHEDYKEWRKKLDLY